MLSTICGDDILEKERFFVEEPGQPGMSTSMAAQWRRYCRDRTQARDPGAELSESGWQGSNRRSILQEDQYARASIQQCARNRASLLAGSAGAQNT
jgi:hypothetical protein